MHAAPAQSRHGAHSRQRGAFVQRSPAGILTIVKSLPLGYLLLGVWYSVMGGFAGALAGLIYHALVSRFVLAREDVGTR